LFILNKNGKGTKKRLTINGMAIILIRPRELILEGERLYFVVNNETE
jgi:hypothetical protein